MSITDVKIEDDLKKLEDQRWQETLEGLEDVRMSRVIDGHKIHAWLESWGIENYKKQLLKCTN